VKRWRGTLWGRSIAVVSGCVLLVAVACGAWVGWIQAFGNVSVEFGGDVVRTAQVGPEVTAQLVKAYRIETVLNLRGPNPGDDWFDGEVQAVEKAGARHVSLALSANEEPNERLLATLIDTLKTAKKPILIHCNWGSDRTGLAAALYGLTVKKMTADAAAGQLSFRYGHFPWLMSQTGAMDRTFWRVANAMGVK
jgi:protein tyrosine/serine phosphatase